MNCFAINSVQPILRNGMQQKLLQYRCHEIRLFEANMQDEYTSKCYTFFGSKFVLFSIPYHVLFHLTSCSSFMTVLKQESSWSSKKCTQCMSGCINCIYLDGNNTLQNSLAEKNIIFK